MYLRTVAYVTSEWCSKDTFDFTEIVNNPRLKFEARNKMLKCEIYFPRVSGIMHTGLELFSQYNFIQYT